jgi:hypothetical protein
MRTGEIVDLANERRLNAALDFTHAGVELLILNGGSRAEEFIVVTMIKSRIRKERRSAYCIDSGTSMNLTLPLLLGESADDITIRIIGGHGEMLLFAPPLRRVRPALSVHGWATLAAATVLLMLAGGPLDSTSMLASADPEPAPVEAPLVNARLSLHITAPLPSVVAQSAPAIVAASPNRHLPQTTRGAKAAPEHRVLAFALGAPAVPRRPAPAEPAPTMTDLHVPETAKSGDFVNVKFGARGGRQVKIVASIGPTIVSRTIVHAQKGEISIRSPKSDRDSRIMTVRAYAQDGTHSTSTLQAIVVLVRP